MMSQQPGNNWEVKWDTPGFPVYCFGRWIIKKNGEEIQLPEEKRTNHMNTFGKHEIDEYWEPDRFVIDGLKEDEWIRENWYWLESACDSLEDAKMLYRKISKQDWRHGCCGGCV